MGTMDQGFVPEPPGRVYARLADVDAYPEWWTGVRTRDGTIAIPGLPHSEVTVERDRPRVGLVLRLRGGGVDASLEWYLERFKEGTVVNAILELDETGERRRMRVRRGLREAMVALRRLAEAG